MWEIKFARQNGVIDFMWYGSAVSREDAEWSFHCMADVGLTPISLREVQRSPTDREYLAMQSEANKAQDRYRVITYCQDSGTDEKRSCDSIAEAKKAALTYINNVEPLNGAPRYDGAIVYDTQAKCVVIGLGRRFPDSALPSGCKY